MAPSAEDDRGHRNEPTRAYSRKTVEYVLGAGEWRGWDDMLDWLRSNGNNDRNLTPDEVRDLRQDAERAGRMKLPFAHEAAELRSVLNRARRREP